MHSFVTSEFFLNNGGGFTFLSFPPIINNKRMDKEMTKKQKQVLDIAIRFRCISTTLLSKYLQLETNRSSNKVLELLTSRGYLIKRKIEFDGKIVNGYLVNPGKLKYLELDLNDSQKYLIRNNTKLTNKHLIVLLTNFDYVVRNNIQKYLTKFELNKSNIYPECRPDLFDQDKNQFVYYIKNRRRKDIKTLNRWIESYFDSGLFETEFKGTLPNIKWINK